MAIDRTQFMGLFPHDPVAGDFTDRRSVEELLSVVANGGLPTRDRDIAIWLLVHRGAAEAADRLLDIANTDQDPILRRSASWGLLKLMANGSANPGLLSGLDVEDPSVNVRAWKKHLVAEATGTLQDPGDSPVRRLSSAEFDVSMPLFVEGQIQFVDAENNWHRFSVGGPRRTELVGDMTAFVRSNTFMTDLVIQKNLQNFDGQGRDFIEGYKFSGFSRLLEPSRMVHYYESLWEHDLYLSGRTGDASAGVLNGVRTHLFRTAETDLQFHEEIGPHPVAVRGIFFGSVFVAVETLLNPDGPMTGAVQIVSRSDPDGARHANGVFFGSFRGVPIDVDDDGTVEINGIPSYVSADGTVLDQTPPSRGYEDMFSMRLPRID